MEDQAVGRIVISLLVSGRINIEGIPDNRIICYGMLEMAKQAINQYYKDAADRMVQPVQMMPSIKQ